MTLNILVDMILPMISLFSDTHAQDKSNSTLASLPSWLWDALQDDHEYPMWVTDKCDPYNWHEVLKKQLGCDPPAIAKSNFLN